MSTSSVQALAERKNRQVGKHLIIEYQIKENAELDADICVSCDPAEALCLLSLERGWQVL